MSMKKNRKAGQGEAGAVTIAEASIVFPVMFICLIILIYMGNAFYIKAQVAGVVDRYAVIGASYCVDPLLNTIKQSGVPTLRQMHTKPYRYLFGGMDEVESKIQQDLMKELRGNTGSFFKNMKPRLKSSGQEVAKYNNYVVYATFSVELEYEIIFPITYFGRELPVLEMHEWAEAPVSDAPEFIRNTDMAIDLFHGTKVAKTVEDAFSKVNAFISNFAKK